MASAADRRAAGEPGSPAERAPELWVADDPLFDEHRARGHHPERPERLLAARAALERVAGQGTRLRSVSPADATRAELTRVHAPGYLDDLESRRGRHSALDADTFVGPRSVEAAYRAAGAAMALTAKLLEGEGPRRGVAVLRPPGHHARPAGGMGFCLLNNVALAAAEARARGVARVAVVDWDVHHGNGTEEAFYEDPSVLVISLHQDAFYPGTGQIARRGAGRGEGFNLNIPLSAGAGDAVYVAAFERVVLPVLERFAPELLLVSAGFDAHARDPLAGMMLTDAGFGRMAAALAGVADRHAGGRIGLVLEGGYDLEGVERSLASSLLALDRGAPESSSASAMGAHHAREIDAARAVARRSFDV